MTEDAVGLAPPLGTRRAHRPGALHGGRRGWPSSDADHQRPGRLGRDGYPSRRPRLHQLGAWWRAAGAGRLAPDGGRGRDGLGEPPVGTDGGPARRSRADVLDRRPGDDDRLLDLAAAGLLPVSYTHLTLPTIYSV